MEDRPQDQSQDATVTPETIRATARVYTLGIVIKSHLWLTWGEIVIDEEANARAARSEELTIVKHTSGKEGLSDALLRELKASLVSIAATSHSLDALYGVIAEMVIPPDVRRTWRDKGTRRPGQVFETLKRAVDVDARTRERWGDELGWLFDARDSAVHFREETGEPVPHPSGTQTGGVHNMYSSEAAGRAVDLLLEVLTKVVESPNRRHPAVVRWSGDFRETVARLRTRRDNG